MFPAAFEYRPAHSTDEALAILAEHGGDARVLAGGQSLIPAMRFRLARPAVLVDINPVDALSYLREEGNSLRIGARTRDVLLERSAMIRSKYPMIADASDVVADPVVRQMGTVVGSLCHNDPTGDWPVVAVAGKAQVLIRSAKGERSVAIDDFLGEFFETAVGDGELATEVRFPVPGGRTSGGYAKLERKVGDFATACAGVQVTLAADGKIADAGIAIGGVGPKALRVAAAEKLLRGATPSKSLVEAAAAEAKKVADPIGDTRGSADYKREMAGVLVARALGKTFERLGVGGQR